MSVYIKGMEMPTRCIACQLNYDSCACILTGSRFYKYNTEFDPGEERLPDCPLIPVPDHGRLIEDCAVKNKIANQYFDNEFARGWNAAMKQCYEAVEDAPTIIPADPAKEGEG